MKKCLLWLLILLSLTCIMACEKSSNSINPNIAVDYVFPTFLTEMSAESIIALPEGVSCDFMVINSLDEFHEIIPDEVARTDEQYNNIDFSKNSIISIKFRVFYPITNISYRIMKRDDYVIEIKQLISTSGQMHDNGCFVMANLSVDKIPKEIGIYLQQSFKIE